MYNTNAITLEQAKKVAIAYIKAGIIPLLVSPPGIGKSTIVGDIARELNAELRHLRLNSMPPEEAIGLQFLDHKTKRTIRYAPSWLPSEDGTDGNVVVFIDEMMQAPDEYRKGIMSALLERYLGQHKIPQNCMFIAAGNSIEDGSQVYELDRATADRFGIILIRPDFESWANDYAFENNVSTALVGYLRHRPDHFELTDPDAVDNPDIVIKPSPRSWVALSRFLDAAKIEGLNDEEIKAGINGKVGETIGACVWQLLGVLKDMPSLQEILKMNSKDRKKATPTQMEVLWSYGQSMIWHATNARATLQVMELFNDFDGEVDIPMIECRTNVIETILKRARKVHNFSVAEEPRIKEILLSWESEKKLLSSNDTSQDQESTEFKRAA